MGSTTVLEFRDVSYEIDGRPILRNITFSVAEGETVVLLGRSGSGKTTLLKTVNRLIEPTSGSVVFQGKPVRDWDLIRLRRSIGYVIQDAGLFPHRTVEQNVGLVPALEKWQPEAVKERTSSLLNAMALPPSEYGRRFPRQLSGGQRQRVGIARALAADPPLLLLDEPFAALDPVTRFELQQQFLVLRQTLRKTALFVTHDVREALRMGTRIVLLNLGEMEAMVPAQEFPALRTPEALAFVATLK
jgi:osmoprotectant transport system ATP-binding protein